MKVHRFPWFQVSFMYCFFPIWILESQFQELLLFPPPQGVHNPLKRPPFFWGGDTWLGYPQIPILVCQKGSLYYNNYKNALLKSLYNCGSIWSPMNYKPNQKTFGCFGLSAKTLRIKWDNFNTVQRNRNFDITQCVTRPFFRRRRFLKCGC